jgi:hypothetical protein
MNEQIEQLALQAGFNLHNDVIDGHDFKHEIEKLAELLVVDCCQKLIDMDQQVKGSHNYYRHAAIQIRLHFGLEL